MNLSDFNLDSNENLTSLGFTSEEDWLELRRKGIGGSDIGAIMGLNKYASPLSIYKAKVEGKAKDLSDNVNVQRGKDLEDLILDKWIRPKLIKEGYLAGKPDFMIINAEYPFFRANVDGIAYKVGGTYKDNMIIEIKCISDYGEAAWGHSEYCGVPPYYYAQVQLYMAVTGISRAIVCALFDREWECHFYDVPRDEEFIARLIEEGRKFYTYNMLMHIPPKIVVNLDKEDVVEAIKKSEEPTTPSATMTKLVEQYNLLGSKIKELETAKNGVESRILDGYTQGYKPDNPDMKVKLSVIKNHRFNSTKFKAAHPDMYEQYCEDSESSRFTIK